MVKTKILLVEDDKSLREIYGVRLYSEGYDIISAGDGEEALAMAIKERPNLIISDVMMPKISGFDMLDILRSTTETKGIKVIMMTALSSEDQRARGEALGADRYLVKSQVGIEDVVRTVHEVLGDAPVGGAAIAPTATTVSSPAQITSEPTAIPDPAAASTLPQPTTPFVSNRPAGLGDRVINPLGSSEPSKDFGALMSAELSGAPQPGISPVAQTIPEAPVADLESLVPPIPTTSSEQVTGTDTTTMPTPTTPPPVATPLPGNDMQASPVATPEAPAYGDSLAPTLPPEMPAAPTLGAPVEPAATDMSFEETPYAPNPVISAAPPAVPTTDQPNTNDEPPIVVPPRSTPGV